MTTSVSLYHAAASLQRAIRRVDEYHETKDTYHLLYAALETRLCIERTLFEYLVLIRRGDLSKKLEKLYKATDLKNAILREEPKFFKKLEFVNLFVSEFLRLPAPVVMPELDLLSTSYGRCNNFLHCPRHLDDVCSSIDWWAPLKDSLDLAICHLIAIHKGSVAFIDLNEEGERLFAKFVSGELSRDEIAKELRSISPSSPHGVP
jgi:hypothetical protein